MNGWYVLLVGKTPWDVGPLVRYDTFEDYTRWTFGAYYGEPDAPLRFLLNYELREEEDVTHDHRAYVWAQVRFDEWVRRLQKTMTTFAASCCQSSCPFGPSASWQPRDNGS